MLVNCLCRTYLQAVLFGPVFITLGPLVPRSESWLFEYLPFPFLYAKVYCICLIYNHHCCDDELACFSIPSGLMQYYR